MPSLIFRGVVAGSALLPVKLEGVCVMKSRKIAKAKIRYCKKCKVGRIITSPRGLIFCSLCGAEYKRHGKGLRLVTSNY